MGIDDIIRRGSELKKQREEEIRRGDEERKEREKEYGYKLEKICKANRLANELPRRERKAALREVKEEYKKLKGQYPNESSRIQVGGLDYKERPVREHEVEETSSTWTEACGND